MNEPRQVPTDRVAGFATGSIDWIRLQGSGHFDYPIDYSIAVLRAEPATGRADFLIKWEPNAYCHFHRHTGATTTFVLEGAHHGEESTPPETVHKTRVAGHVARNPAGDVHMEYAGPEGAVVLFSMHSDDGRLFDILDREQRVLVTVTVEDLQRGRLPV